ncbi:MAG: RAMP superfamily CRISPR-associated protein [Caldilineaceae bacterium]|nr:RAMP superfamily CRISPR-associated protein [Caldilineaceae bacterium]
MRPQRLDLHYSINWQGDWHVGSGYESAATDRLVRRMPHNGQPFVPGSQIKGLLRHQCERLATSLQAAVVDPHAGNPENDRRLVEGFVPLANSELVIDRLFGTRYQGECLFVTNALSDSEEGSAALQTRARTAMDRVTRTVKEGNLFTTQLADRSFSLQGSLRARHPAGVLTQEDEGFPYEYALLVASLLTLNAFGGDKSVGLGQCSIKLTRDIRWNRETITLPDALRSLEEEEWHEMMQLVREEEPA